MIGIYHRTATTEQKDRMEQQIDDLIKYCDSMGWQVYKVFADAGFSGSNTDRPALQEMMTDLRDGKIDKVLVNRLDRLSRSPEIALQLMDEILENNADFVSVIDGIDSSLPSGKTKINILKGFAV